MLAAFIFSLRACAITISRQDASLHFLRHFLLDDSISPPSPYCLIRHFAAADDFGHAAVIDTNNTDCHHQTTNNTPRHAGCLRLRPFHFH